MKINNFFIIFLSLMVLLNSCQPLKDGLVGNKRSKSSDEFFIKKKSPLVQPPDYDEIPLPKISDEKKIDEPSIEELFNNDEEVDQEQPSQDKSTDSLEKSILEKISKN